MINKVSKEQTNTPKKVLTRKTNTQDRNYTDNDRFLTTLQDYKKQLKVAKKAGEKLPRIPEYIGEYFLLIATHLGQKAQYNRYSYLDLMISDGIENCLTYFENFNPKKSKNPFAYFTQVIIYAFWRRIAKEHKQQYIKYKAMDMANFINNLNQEDLSELPEDMRTELSNNIKSFDNINDFMRKYEEKQEEKKIRVRMAKKA